MQASTELRRLATEAFVCKQLAQSRYVTVKKYTKNISCYNNKWPSRPQMQTTVHSVKVTQLLFNNFTQQTAKIRRS